MQPTPSTSNLYDFLPSGSFARYATLEWDRGAYADVNSQGRHRKIIRMISRAPDTPVSIMHNFQIGSIESSAGNGPTLHAHDYPEIFIPIRSDYWVDYGRDGRNRARLGTYDTFSLPLNVLRTFEAVEEAPRESQMLSLFDTQLQDAKTGIKVTPEIAAADRALGVDQGFEVSQNLLDISVEEAESRYIARFANLNVENIDGMLLRRLIGSDSSRAALRTPHNIEVDFIEVPAGQGTKAYASNCREVYVALEGPAHIDWRGKPVVMDRLDVFSVEAKAMRSINAEKNRRALLLRIRDLTNPH